MQQYSYDDAMLDKSVADFGMDSFDLFSYRNDSSSKNNWSLSIEIENYQNGNNNTQVHQFKQEDNADWYQQKSLLHASAMMSPISPATTVNSSPSPCPSENFQFKREVAFLPPSPPESNGVPSPQYHHEFKMEQVDNLLSPSSTEDSIDISKILQENFKDEKKDYNTLREVLQDTSFQRKHNLKPLTLESLFGEFEQEKDIEPVISLALQHAKLEIQATCGSLNISTNPQNWTSKQVQLWINFTIKQFELDSIPNSELIFPENGPNFAMLSDEDFYSRANQTGSVLHAQLEIWKAAYTDASYIVDNTLTSSDNVATNIADNSTSQWMLNDEQMFSDNNSEGKFTHK